MRSSCSSAWVAKRLEKTRVFEVQKLLWKIFSLGPKALNESEEFEAFELLRSLRRVSVCCMVSELKDKQTFLIHYNDVTTRLSKEVATGQEKAKQCILKSKLFARTLKTLHKFHTSADEQTAATPAKPLLGVGKSVRNYSNGRQNVRQPKGRGRNIPPSSSATTHRCEKPSLLDSVFVSSLSSRGRSSKQTKKTFPKNRPGQRTRRQLAEVTYGSAAKHFRKGNSRPHPSHSDTHKPRKAVARPPTVPRASHTHKTTPTEQLHPSWEASKKKKEMNKLLEPQGKRTVFNDSD